MRTLTSTSCIFAHHALELLNLLIFERALNVFPSLDARLIATALECRELHAPSLCLRRVRRTREVRAQRFFDYGGEADAAPDRVGFHLDEQVFVQPNRCPMHG